MKFKKNMKHEIRVFRSDSSQADKKDMLKSGSG